jgi:histidine triad (HIT) family protein
MECHFCKIARKEISSKIVYEDENFVAFLDIYPRSKGMTLVIPKKHVKSLDEDEDLSGRLFLTCIKIARAIMRALSPKAIAIAYLPSHVEHLHLRIYPYFENEIPLIENKPVEVKKEELESLAETIRNSMEGEVVQKTETAKESRYRSEEEIFWLKRDWQIA